MVVSASGLLRPRGRGGVSQMENKRKDLECIQAAVNRDGVEFISFSIPRAPSGPSRRAAYREALFVPFGVEASERRTAMTANSSQTRRGGSL